MGRPRTTERRAPRPGAATCRACQSAVAESDDRCAACEEPAGYPNVRAAAHSSEEKALQVRRAGAMEALSESNAGAIGLAFEAAVNEASRAVTNRTALEFHQIVMGTGMFAPFYALAGAGLRDPNEGPFNRARAFVDRALFPGYHERVHFAALTLTSQGLTSYGACTIALRSAFIHRRASVFDGNSLLRVMRADPRLSELIEAPVRSGCRAPWVSRGTMALVQLAVELSSTTTAGEFPAILLSKGHDNLAATFVEVHIWGRLNLDAVEAVRVDPADDDIDRSLYLRMLREKLGGRGIRVAEG